MPFTIRPHRRLSVHCAVTYNVGSFRGQGTIWNLSLYGWKLSGDVPLQVGETCSLTVNLPFEESIVVAAAIVRWVRGREFGLETVAIEKQTHSRVEHVIKRLVTGNPLTTSNEQRPPTRDSMSLEEATIFNMWEIVTALKVPVAELVENEIRNGSGQNELLRHASFC